MPWLLRQDGRALLLPGPSRPRRGRVGNSPKGRAHDARAFAVRPLMACQRTSGAASRRRRADARRPRPRGCVLFGYFLLHKQEKVTRPPGWRTKNHRDVSRLSRNANRRKSEITPTQTKPKHERHQNLLQPPSTSTNHKHNQHPHSKKQRAASPTLLKPPMRG